MTNKHSTTISSGRSADVLLHIAGGAAGASFF